jgi:hypothetical protein
MRAKLGPTLSDEFVARHSKTIMGHRQPHRPLKWLVVPHPSVCTDEHRIVTIVGAFARKWRLL